MNATLGPLWAAILTLAGTPVSSPESFTLLPVDGEPIVVRELALDANGSLTARADPRNDPLSLKLDDLLRISPTCPDRRASDPSAPPGPQLFFLADGGRLPGSLRAAAPGGRGVIADVGLGDPITIPFHELAAIRLAAAPHPDAERELSARIESRDATRDTLIAVGDGAVTALPGVMESLSPEQWAFRFGQKVRKGPTNRAYAVVFARGSAARPPAGTRVRLAGGGNLAATLHSADATGIRLSAAFAPDLNIPWVRIDRIDVHSNRVTYLSDLTPSRAESRGYFGHPWPWRADEALGGGPLRAGGRTFDKGLAVHAYSLLEYDLGGKYQRFAAALAIEDASETGCVVFRVSGDGRSLFESDSISARQAPRAIIVPIEGVRRLTLEVLFGDGLDLGDRAVWGDARVIR